MKKHFTSKTLIALAVAIAAAAAYETEASEQPMPPPANVSMSVLPAGIAPGTPAAEVLKLAQAGVDAGIIKNYINNCPSAFNLDADKIIALTDAGISSDMVNAMMAHDKAVLASITPPPVSAPAPAPVTTSAPANNSGSTPPPEMTVDEFNNTLSPYGQWVEVEGYGRCWRPTVVNYDPTWQPYCDRGHWVYTDCGWYWESDYPWGVTFHYGRWFNTGAYGWCWWPDTVWAPSWVVWRSCDDYCGWAPLPPFTVYEPGFGFYYRGAGVAVGFDFGLAAVCYTFVPIGSFCEIPPRTVCVAPVQVTAVFNRTVIINNYGSINRTIVNNGVSVTTIGAAARHPIQPVSVGSLVNGSHHGWQGRTGSQGTPAVGGNSAGSSGSANIGGSASGRESAWQNSNVGQRVNSANAGNPNPVGGNATGHRPPFSQPVAPAMPTTPATRPSESVNPGHAQPSQNQNAPAPGRYQDQRNQRQSGYNWHNNGNSQAQAALPPATSNARNNWLSGGSERAFSGARSPIAETHLSNAGSALRGLAAAAPSANLAGLFSGGGDKLQNVLGRWH